jgi:hypothetical protein
LLDVIDAVREVSSSDEEIVQVLAHLFSSGQVRLRRRVARAPQAHSPRAL